MPVRPCAASPYPARRGSGARCRRLTSAGGAAAGGGGSPHAFGAYDGAIHSPSQPRHTLASRYSSCSLSRAHLTISSSLGSVLLVESFSFPFFAYMSVTRPQLPSVALPGVV